MQAPPVWSPERNRANARAHQRAKQKLVELHRAQYQELLDVEKRRERIRPARQVAQ